MRWGSLLFLVLAMSLSGCARASQECKSRTQDLRTRLAEIDWSLAYVTPEFAYQRVPIAGGQTIPGPPAFSFTVAIDGSQVALLKEVHPVDQPLEKWLAYRAGLHYGVLAKKRDPEEPLYLLATADTRVSTVRTIVHSLEPLAIVRLAVRPTRAQAEPWAPSTKGRLLFEQVARRRPNEDSSTWLGHFVDANETPAVGCSEALDLVMRHGLHSYERLQRLPDAFEQCGCGGDMDTLAAFLWRQSIEDDMKPVRWHPWDEKLVQQLGDDATYADLVQALVAKASATATK